MESELTNLLTEERRMHDEELERLRAELATESLRELEEQHKWYTEELRSVEAARDEALERVSALLDEQLAEMQSAHADALRSEREGLAAALESLKAEQATALAACRQGGGERARRGGDGRLSARRRRPVWRRTVSTARVPGLTLLGTSRQSMR